MSVPLFSPTITHFAISHLCFESIFLQALHPLFDVVCCCRGLVCLCCSLGAPLPPSLSSLFHYGICNGSMTFLYSAHHHFHLSFSPGPINWTGQVESNIPLHHQRGSPSLSDHHPKNKIAYLGARTTASVIHSSRPPWNINKPVHTWEGGGWSPPPSPKVTLTWMQ